MLRVGDRVIGVNGRAYTAMRGVVTAVHERRETVSVEWEEPWARFSGRAIPISALTLLVPYVDVVA